MYKGHILATLDAETATREQLGLLMAGVTPSEAEQVAAGPREGIDPREGKEEGAHV
jgi:hypothetical protein